MIYIACPEKFATGGTELLHQLYYKLKFQTTNVKMFYYNYSGIGNPVNERFEKYNVEYVDEIIDIENNILIVPEVNTGLLNKYENINKSVWWLSVDNYFKSFGNDKNIIKAIIKKLILVFNGKYFGKRVNFKDTSILHLYQSYYAKDFLEKKNVNKLEYLSDYLGSNFLKEHADFTDSNRWNKVLYNPQKGIEFTKKIIDFDSSIEYIPLVNMSQEQIIELCKISKVYIDFGNHPGKDRFPREAAHLGCIIITGQKGSAKYHKDVMIPEEYKFEDEVKNIPAITSQINNVFNNYNDNIGILDEYRQMIKNEEKIFEEDVQNVWSKYLKRFS